MLRGLVVCVNYDDILKYTLPWNVKNLHECLVVTSPEDHRTAEFVNAFAKTLQYPECDISLFQTDAFTRYGAKFNKGLAIEEAYDYWGRQGWNVIWDADIAFPKGMRLDDLRTGNLYGARRRMAPSVDDEILDGDWTQYPIGRDIEFAGFFQLFNASDHVLQQTPWYDPTFIHAGGGDAFFQSLWGSRSKVRLDIECLHIGPRDENWYGRVSSRVDGIQNENVAVKKQSMQNMKISNGWIKDARKHVRVKDRVKIPGYTSTFIWNKSNPETDVINP